MDFDLVTCPGSQYIQAASRSDDVLVVVNILLLLYEEDRDFFKAVASFLVGSHTALQSGAIQWLRQFYQPRPSSNSEQNVPLYVNELLTAISRIYQQDEKTLNYRRGAIVELFAYEFVRRHCSAKECCNNYCFVISHPGGAGYKYKSRQVDVAVLSNIQRELEGYACKISPRDSDNVKLEGVTNITEDCQTLTTLFTVAQDNNYKAHVGVVCFVHSRKIRMRLKDFQIIEAYGVDNLKELERDPFKDGREP
jgi:hypothetical protein